jgi:hypothetical protein
MIADLRFFIEDQKEKDSLTPDALYNFFCRHSKMKTSCPEVSFYLGQELDPDLYQDFCNYIVARYLHEFLDSQMNRRQVQKHPDTELALWIVCYTCAQIFETRCNNSNFTEKEDYPQFWNTFFEKLITNSFYIADMPRKTIKSEIRNVCQFLSFLRDEGEYQEFFDGESPVGFTFPWKNLKDEAKVPVLLNLLGIPDMINTVTLIRSIEELKDVFGQDPNYSSFNSVLLVVCRPEELEHFKKYIPKVASGILAFGKSPFRIPQYISPQVYAGEIVLSGRHECKLQHMGKVET